MFRRPLIPILFFFTGGILTGHFALPHHPVLAFSLSLFIAITLLFSYAVPSSSNPYCLVFAFFLLGALFDLNQHQESDLTSLANQRARVMIEGTVLEPARYVDDGARLVVRSDRLFVRGSAKEIREKVLLRVYHKAREITPGEKIRFKARLAPFKNFNNPGRYNYELAMRLKGLSCAASVSDGRQIVPMGTESLGFPMDLLEQARGPIRNLFIKNLSPPNQALFRALILGERQVINPDFRETFNRAGLGHILAVSGLHIGLVAWLSFSLLVGFLSLSYRLVLTTDVRKLAAVMTCFPVVVYTCIAGFQISSQRAMIMVLAYLFSMILGREKDIWSTFSLAAVLILALSPHSVFSISFHLSFGAVAGILWLGPWIYERISAPVKGDLRKKRAFERVYVYFAGLTAVTLSAMIFLFPMLSFYFHQISLVAVPANLTVVPILGLWIIPLGLLSALTLSISSSLAGFLLQLGAWGMDGMFGLIQFWAKFSWASQWVIRPNAFEILLFYSLLLFILSLRRWAWAKLALLLVVFVVVADVCYWTYRLRFNPHLSVTYLDVGQGNAALIKFI